MIERNKIRNSLMVMGIAFSHTACNPQKGVEIIPTESCPPVTLSEPNLEIERWLSMDIAGEPFIIPVSADDPTNPDNQVTVSLESVIPNKGVALNIQMPNEEPKMSFIENDPTTALKFAQEIDIGIQFWACDDNDSAFFRLVPLSPLIQNFSA